MLFPFDKEELSNILPRDGKVSVFPNFLNLPANVDLFERLLKTIPWEADRIILFGKEIITQRKVAWFGDESFPYTYSKATKYALPWTTELTQIKAQIENKTGFTFNSCLLNLYADGTQGMGYHADNEKNMAKGEPIASLSLGETRKFVFKHNESKEKVSIILQNGDLLLMRDETQEYWKHALPPMRKQTGIRINLTFRTFVY